ncbi:phage regulatory CII family protein [Paramagnetospirillum caucaseum]|nr:phage regulatory CII family protein [Paramagnetospirillum caucaseum]
MTVDPGPDSDVARLRAAAAFAQHVGDHMPLSREMVVAATGFEPRTVKAHALGQTTPTLSAFLAYCRVLPVTYAQQVLALAGLTGFRRQDGDTAPAAALAEMAEGVAALAEALADGRIDHTERPKVIRELREAIGAAEALIARLESQP